MLMYLKQNSATRMEVNGMNNLNSVCPSHIPLISRFFISLDYMISMYIVQLQNDLTRLVEWSKQWQMTFHPAKCFILRVTKLEAQVSLYRSPDINKSS